MKSITIHNLDEELDRSIRQRASREGVSLNRTIKSLLRQAIGLGAKKAKKRDVSKYFGVWTKKELEEFEANTADFEKIDEEIWR